MRMRLIIVAVLVATLTACKFPGVETSQPLPATPETAVASTVKICDFLPDLTAVADLISAAPEVKTAEGIAKMICDKFLTLEPQKMAKPGVAVTNFNVDVNDKAIPIKGWAIIR